MTAEDYVGTSALHDRGWTEAAIKRFLGDADKRVPNPVYKSAAPRRGLLDSAARADQAEASAEWKEWRRAADKRSARSTAAADAKRADLLAEVDALNIRVPVMDLTALARAAVRHRNDRDADRADVRGEISFAATADSTDQATLDRWMVNYLRHRHTSYDADLSQLTGGSAAWKRRRLSGAVSMT